MNILRHIGKILCLLLLEVPSTAFPQSPEEFLQKIKAPQDVVSHMLTSNKQIRRCVGNETMLICVFGRNYPNISENAVARNAVLKNANLLVNHDLDIALAERIQAPTLLNQQTVGETFSKQRQKGLYALKGREFTSFCRSNWCGAVAAIPLAEAAQALPKIYGKQEFKQEYCATLMPKAISYFNAAKYNDALQALKELHDLKYANAEAYLLAVQAFIHENEPQEATKIAKEIWTDLKGQLTAIQAENLGDCFMALRMEHEAELAYNFSLQLLNRQ